MHQFLSSSILLAICSLFLLNGCGATKGKPMAEMAAAEFHQALDKGEFSAIYAASHADFKKASTEKDFVALLEAVHRKLGPIKAATAAGWQVNSFNLKTNVVLTYNTAFTEGAAVEKFTYRIQGGKAWLVGYNISSNTLITK
jgi:hypothetical protein